MSDTDESDNNDNTVCTAVDVCGPCNHVINCTCSLRTDVDSSSNTGDATIEVRTGHISDCTGSTKGTGSITASMRDYECSFENNEELLEIQTPTSDSSTKINDLSDKAEHNTLSDFEETLFENNVCSGDHMQNSLILESEDGGTDEDILNYNHNLDEFLYETSDDENYEEENEEPAFDLYKNLTSMINNEKSNEIVNATFVVNEIEILLAILKYAQLYSLPHSAVADLAKMLNSFVDKKIVPDSRYRLDKLIYPKEGMQFHAVCPTCKIYAGQFDKATRYKYCSVCETHINVKTSSYRDFFVTLDVDNEIRNVLEDYDEDYVRIVSERDNLHAMEDIFDGHKYRKFVESLPLDRKKSYASAIFNTDGTPVFKSSKFAMWPIQMVINELPSRVRNKSPIIMGAWFGKDKPKMTSFLTPFVNYLNHLSTDGIKCKIGNEFKSIYVYGICCCVDSVARAPMQGLTQFNGYYGCNWCLHPGKPILHDKSTTIKYVLLDEIPLRRTEESTIDNMKLAVHSTTPIFGVRNVSPLINLEGFDIVRGFVPDPMHCIDLGVAKQFAEYWFATTNEEFSVSKRYIEIIDKQLNKMTVPSHLARLSRGFSDRNKWKAKEWENWILYYSIPLLSPIPNFEKFLKHWLLLVEAYHILLKDRITVDEVLQASNQLKRFISHTELLYSPDAMSFNVHQLNHLAQSVVDWGPLWSHSGYAFESENGRLKAKVFAANGVLSQLCRSMSMKTSISLLQKKVAQIEMSPVKEFCYYLENRCTQKTIKNNVTRYFGKKQTIEKKFADKFSLNQNLWAFDKIVKGDRVYKSEKTKTNRSNNSFAQTNTNEFIQIVKFLLDQESMTDYIIYKKIFVEMPFHECRYINKVINISNQEEIMKTCDLGNICVYINVNENNYIVPMPNMYWIS